MIVSVQPRIRLLRSFDERSHSYLGYILRVHGRIEDEEQDFTVAVGKAAHEKHVFRRGDVAVGEGVMVSDRLRERADVYKLSKLSFLERDTGDNEAGPPWHTLAPPLIVYRERGHRRLAENTYDAHCRTCVWGSEMAVEMIIDHWKPNIRRYRTETFCYGPLSCRLYKAGPKRRVPGRNGMVHVEEDWVDESDVGDRGPDD